MQTYELIKKKRSGGELTREELTYLIEGYTRGNIPDYQISAFMMAVYFQGMTDNETYNYTDLLLHSGTTIDLSVLKKISVDKHSTGGVGDKVSIPLSPLVAAAGVPVPMISGRGLGHTGGTLDKLESIPGFRVNLTKKEFLSALKKYNMAMMGQTADIVPADKKLYALRDVTGTIESMPLIVGSILSKKLAEGANGIVFDVKTGSGAFMHKRMHAMQLAMALVKMAKKFGQKSVALVTDMDQPLGNAVGNALEIRESIALLQGKGPEDLEKIVAELGGYMLLLGKKAKTQKEGRNKIYQLIENGEGLKWFKLMVKAQGGNPKIVDNPELLPTAKHLHVIKSEISGYLHELDAMKIGRGSVLLGAGRERIESIIDPAVGIMHHKKVGDQVEKGEPVMTIHYNEKAKLNLSLPLFMESFEVKPAPAKTNPLIMDIIQ